MVPILILLAALFFLVIYLGKSKDTAKDAVDKTENNGVFVTLNKKLLPKLKKTHDAIENAIYSIAPKKRESASSYPIIVVNDESLPKVKTKIIKMIERDLKLDEKNAPIKLMNKIDDLFDFYSAGVEEYNEDYFELDLSDKFGGISTIRIGVLGMKKIKQKILIGICLYFEQWEEKEWVKLNLEHSIWNKQNVKDFAKYKLYTEVGRKFELRCNQILKQLDSQNVDDKKQSDIDKIDELSEWLNKLKLSQYYDVFKNNGFDDLDTISEIDVSNDNALKNLGIIKPGHLIKFKKAVKALNVADEHDGEQDTNYL